MTRKSTNAATTATTAYTFGVDTMTVLGRTYDARYSCTPKGHVYVFTSLPIAEGDAAQAVPVRLHFAPDMPMYAAAYKAAKAAKVAPLNPHDPTAPKEPSADAAPKAPAKQEKPAAEAAPKAPAKQEKPAKAQPKAAKPAPKAQPKAEKPAAKAPAKPAAKPAAKQPKAEALTAANYVGKCIVGDGWKIAFDADAQRTRVTFAKQASLAQKQAVDAAGFYWSAAMGSFNKKLTTKAFRAAMALADTLKALK